MQKYTIKNGDLSCSHAEVYIHIIKNREKVPAYEGATQTIENPSLACKSIRSNH